MSDNPFFDKYAEGYAKSVSHAKGADLDLLMSIIPDGLNICLDVATGTGFTAAALSQKCKRVIAIDETENMITKARDLMKDRGIRNVEFIKTPFESYETDIKFDAITIRRALHHFNDKSAFFSKASKLIAENGTIAIADMVSPEDDDEDNFNMLERIRDPTHVGALKISEYRNLAELHGLKILSMNTTIEELTFEKWLYPVPMDSETAKKCLSFLNGLTADQLRRMRFDPEKMVLRKERLIIAMAKADQPKM
ncbi:class I SAM-dependent methyltransferase [Thermoplasma sp.]|uniref:class I SAM-dependent methyltransferase n=1 Tax=Thermoplasma sp. TaxID=1973142 RepID=UPI002616C952|nr:class I SAM-dependent methyltransferase [Thermoplasma sp.]